MASASHPRLRQKLLKSTRTSQRWFIDHSGFHWPKIQTQSERKGSAAFAPSQSEGRCGNRFGTPTKGGSQSQMIAR
jgi:hypothetical protein